MVKDIALQHLEHGTGYIWLMPESNTNAKSVAKIEEILKEYPEFMMRLGIQAHLFWGVE
jgi:hypothetical protein